MTVSVLAAEPTATPRRDPRELIPASAWNLLTEDFRRKHHTTHTYCDRVIGQLLVFLYAAGRIRRASMADPGAYVRIVPTPPVDAAWHEALQRTEVYGPLSMAFAGSMLHHRPVVDSDILSGAALARTIPILEATGLALDPEFWDDEAAASCCPPDCNDMGGRAEVADWAGYGAPAGPITLKY